MINQCRCSMCNASGTMEIATVTETDVELQCRNCGYFFEVDTSGTEWSAIAIQILSDLHEDQVRFEGNVYLFPTGERIEL